jgi:tyrosyl-tRNA synthetase
MDIACKNSIARIHKCATIMGKKEEDQLKVSQLFYPCMQCADVFFLDVDFCQLGIDQRKVNMLALEYCKDEKKRPVIVSHGMISGLIEGQVKMSKSNPDSAIFMEDSAKDVEKKIKRAFCPEKIVEGNPILDYCQHIIFGLRESLAIIRKPQNGGDM